MMQSIQWRLNPEEVSKILHNALVFIAPVVAIYLGTVVTAINTDGFQWSDFGMGVEVQGMFILYFVNVALDFFRKLGSGVPASEAGR